MAEEHYFEDQHCSLFNLDNPAPVPFTSWCDCGYRNSLRYIVEEGWSCQGLEEALWRPKDSERRIVFKPHLQPRHWAYGERASIVNMPNELLDIIFSNLMSFFDVASLAMTCQRLYEVSRKRMEDEFEKMLVASWVGDRIFCLGDLVRASDQKWNLTKDEVKTLNLQIKNDPKLSLVEHFEHLRNKNFTSRAIPSSTDPSSNLHDFWCTFQQNFQTSTREIERLRSLLKINLPAYADMYKRSTDPYILRNLITREYIRGDAISRIDISDDHEFNPKYLRFQLTLMIMTMSCRPQYDEWSNLHSDDRRVTFPPDVVLAHRGIWAGNRFDIVTLSRVEEPYNQIIPGWQPSDSPWVDVSQYIIDKATNLFMTRGYDREMYDYYAREYEHEEEDEETESEESESEV